MLNSSWETSKRNMLAGIQHQCQASNQICDNLNLENTTCTPPVPALTAADTTCCKSFLSNLRNEQTELCRAWEMLDHSGSNQ